MQGGLFVFTFGLDETVTKHTGEVCKRAPGSRIPSGSCHLGSRTIVEDPSKFCTLGSGRAHPDAGGSVLPSRD